MADAWDHIVENRAVDDIPSLADQQIQPPMDNIEPVQTVTVTGAKPTYTWMLAILGAVILFSLAKPKGRK